MSVNIGIDCSNVFAKRLFTSFPKNLFYQLLRPLVRIKTIPATFVSSNNHGMFTFVLLVDKKTYPFRIMATKKGDGGCITIKLIFSPNATVVN
jgi:hypothetical protein